ncbi:MAG: hypothetical protein ACRCR1_05710 [Aeromonas sp.]
MMKLLFTISFFLPLIATIYLMCIGYGIKRTIFLTLKGYLIFIVMDVLSIYLLGQVLSAVAFFNSNINPALAIHFLIIGGVFICMMSQDINQGSVER